MDKSIEAISRYAANLKFENLPLEVVHEAKRRLIDTLGCAIGAYNGETSRMARAIARRSVGDPPARILGSQDKSTPEQAAFANATMARFLDFNDAYLGTSSCHPSDALPAVLAVADSAHADGRMVLLATVLAYEVCCNFADVIPAELGWDNVLYDLIAGAVAGARLLGLDAVGIGQAVSLAVVPNMSLSEARIGELTMWKTCAAANACRNGVFAAQLAQLGFTGPASAIEGKWGMMLPFGRFELAPFGGEGRSYRVTLSNIKHYPAQIHSQSPLTLARELRKGINVDDIESVHIHTYRAAAKKYANKESPLWNPMSHETADHSTPYLMASMLLDGEITGASFSAQRIHEERRRALMRKVSITENSEFNAVRPDQWPCRVEIATRSGQRTSAELQYFKGHIRNPLTDAELEGKFRLLAEGLLESRHTDAILDKLWHLERIGDIGEVIELFKVKADAEQHTPH